MSVLPTPLKDKIKGIEQYCPVKELTVFITGFCFPRELGGTHRIHGFNCSESLSCTEFGRAWCLINKRIKDLEFVLPRE
jgi:hypothetical protein